MIAILHSALLVLFTIFAVAAALAFDWMLLRAMFVLMRPATVRRSPATSQVVRGTVQLARVYAPHR
jgi:hypothetical protein